MIISKVRIQNFKKFKDITIDLSSPITFLLGPNSSGKSSIAKCLIAFKQTASQSNDHDAFSAQGEYLDLGTYRDYINEHDIRKNLVFEFETNQILYPRFRTNEDLNENSKIIFEFYHNTHTNQTKVLSIKIKSDEKLDIEIIKKKTRENYLLHCSERFSEYFSKSHIYSKDESSPNKIRAHLEKGISIDITGKYKIEASASKLAVNDELFYAGHSISRFLSNYIERFFKYFEKQFFYLGPLRKSPARSYSRTSHLTSVGIHGENTPSVLANLQSISNSERSKQKPNSNKLTQLNKWIELLMPGCSITAKTIEELVKLEISNKNEKDIISDVGFGVSQILPVLVQLSVIGDEDILLVEQPELHLHPRAQSKFGEILVDSIRSGRRLILETHSEHIIRSIQLAISNKTAKISTPHKIDIDQAKIIYISPKESNKKIMTINEYGEFEEDWPTGFFDESYNASMKIIKNKMQAQTRNVSDSGDK